VSDLVTLCLNLTDAEARQQWRRIAARQWTERRQEPYLPIELVLCFGFFRLINPHQFGGANRHRLPDAMHTLAATFKRPVGSLTNKMLNLEGFRANGARSETELFLYLSRDADQFAALYLRAIEAARAEHLDPIQVPDFLNWLAIAPEPDLLGQHELGTHELGLAVASSADDVKSMQQAYDFGELETSRVVEQRIRLRQHCFASRVLDQYQHRCAFCGLDASTLRGHRLMVASHVKPWASSTNRERLDLRNGIAACTIHDSAFDTGLLTVCPDLSIRRSLALEHLVQSDDAADQLFGTDTIGERLRVPAGASGPGPTFLAYHRREIFRG
jgi:putative restriction endonuclease